jgi:hypothetical protein
MRFLGFWVCHGVQLVKVRCWTGERGRAQVSSLGQAASLRKEISRHEFESIHERESTGCWKTYDLNLSRVRALIDVAWGIATAMYIFPCMALPLHAIFTFECQIRRAHSR